MTKTVNYVAVLGDAIGSRRLVPRARARLQAALQTALRTELNRRWRGDIAARFAIARGDEIEGLLLGTRGLWEIAHYVRAQFPEVDWIIAAGRGPLSTALGATALEVDGPCFHIARLTLEAAKAERRVFAFGGFGERVDALATYYSALYWSWTPRQRRTATLLRLGDPAAAAARLDVDRSAISHLARRMAWPLAAAGDKMFRALLEREPA